MANHIISARTLAELKAMPGGKDNNPVLLLGNTAIGDGAAAHYYWDDTSTEAEDLVYMNVIQSTGITTGRWKKVIARIINLPHGMLVYNGGKKEFFADTVTASDSTATINLTMDNTTNGPAMFSQIKFDDSKATVNTSTANDAVSSCRVSLTNSNKQLKHLFYRGNSNTVSVLGINILSFRGALQNTPVTFKVEGI